MLVGTKMRLFALTFLTSLTYASVAFVLLGQQVHAETLASRAEGYSEMVSQSLTRDEFWAIIDHSVQFEAHPEVQMVDLHASLMRLSPEQIVKFEQLFGETMRESYNWDLWGAAYVANDGASDDGFEYFRCWLISKGRRAFEQVLRDPDSLADIIADGESDGLEFEEIAYVARNAWSKKTGKDWNEMPDLANMIYEVAPEGTPFSEDQNELRRKYPKLWQRFGV